MVKNFIISTKNVLLFIFLLTLSQPVQIQSHNQVSYDPNFIQNIWKEIESTGYQNQMANTTFMKGIRSGQLQILCFIRYMIQQMYYSIESIKLWKQACKDGQKDISFSKFCTQYRDLEMEIKEFLQDMMYVFSADPLDVMKDYVQEKAKVYSQKPYYYISILNYCCYKLYITYFVKILPDLDKKSPYTQYVEQNSQEVYLIDFQNYINSNQHLFDKQQVKMLLLKLVDYEIQFFKQSCPVQLKPQSLKSQ